MIFLTDNSRKKIKNVKLFIVDIDGTFSLSGKPLLGSEKFATAVKNANKHYVFLTNNSNKSIEEYIKEFEKHNIQISQNQIFTAGIETAEYILKKFGKKKIYVIGTKAIKDIFTKFGHKIVEDEEPDIVVVTFDKELTYEKLAKASIFVSKGKLFVLTNPDLNCPTKEGPIPDTGAIASVITKTTHRKPDIIFGKPDPLILEMIIEKFKVKKEETCVIGDRLYTDILLGIRAEVMTILVLTGEAKRKDVEKSNIKPDIIANDLGEISKYI
ncbi:HAD-IIA family hydrolase [Thermosipho atlanticus]|uniref:NagD protein n=1 Tax=Thermosipho atlanticus DSM 15807 TaxID=1123380 RepID=A0A1M5SET9_9BACT|nr:HAD-IIA family hydrolase [Thermosipho atlanticus]SHH36989.1 NagD protein [Thermosipho atlanticus DSM 15807]